MSNRLNDDRSAIVVIMQRLDENDVYLALEDDFTDVAPVAQDIGEWAVNGMPPMECPSGARYRHSKADGELMTPQYWGVTVG